MQVKKIVAEKNEVSTIKTKTRRTTIVCKILKHLFCLRTKRMSTNCKYRCVGAIRHLVRRSQKA